MSPAAVIFAVVGAFALAALVVYVGHVVLAGPLEGLDISGEERAAMQRRARRAMRIFTLAAYGIAAAISVATALSAVGIEVPEWTPRQVIEWALSHGVRTAIIVAAAYFTIRASRLAIDRFEYRTTGETPADLERRRRAQTLGGILSSLVSAVVMFGAALMILEQLAINVWPLLTGAGIAGLAIGFGAQNLVRDVISGFFLILENQVRVGDLARIQNVTGLVEQINLRTIVLRDSDGAVWVFPNGTVTTLGNLSKDFAYAVVIVFVPLNEDVGRVLDELQAIGVAMQSDIATSPHLLGPLEILGVDALGDANATVRVRFKTPPLEQQRVARELRRRIAEQFRERGIRPYAK